MLCQTFSAAVVVAVAVERH